jgi:hypothetical protein
LSMEGSLSIWQAPFSSLSYALYTSHLLCRRILMLSQSRFSKMGRSLHVKLVVTGRRRSKGDPNEPTWPGRVLESLKSWLEMLLKSNKPSLAIRDYEKEPLLEETTVFVPKHAATSFLRTTTPRTTMMYDEESLRM